MCELHPPSGKSAPAILFLVDSDFLIVGRRQWAAILPHVYVLDEVRREVKGLKARGSHPFGRASACRMADEAVTIQRAQRAHRRPGSSRWGPSDTDWMLLSVVVCLLGRFGASSSGKPVVVVTGEGEGITKVAQLDYNLDAEVIPSPAYPDRSWYFVSDASGLSAVRQLRQTTGIPFPIP